MLKPDINPITDDATMLQDRRYIRQTMLADFGEAGQKKLADARVLVIGAGGLGSPLLTYLASAGVGTLGMIDHDRVEISNLPRQILYEQGDIGRLKAQAAKDRLSELSGDCALHSHTEKLDSENVENIITNYDIIADGCDDFQTRFTVNAACLKQQKILISASVIGWQGQLTSFDFRSKTSPCYGCLVTDEVRNANTCDEVGVVNAVAGIMGTMQSLEVIHAITSAPKLVGKLVTFDGKTHQQRQLNLMKDVACPHCSAL